MGFFQKEFTFDRFVRLLITIAIIIGVIWLLDYLSSVLLPFVVAFILAYMLNPFINFLQKFVKKRFLAVLLGLLLIIGFFVLLGMLIIPIISKEVQTAGRIVNEIVQNTDLEAELTKYLPEGMAEKIKEILISKDFQKLFDSKELQGVLNFIMKKVLPHLGNVVSGTVEIILGIISMAIIFLYLFFLLLDFNEMSAGWKTLIPPKYKSAVLSFVYDFENAMNKYFRAQALIASIVGVLFAIGFTIIGLPLGILLGLFIGVLNMVPYLQTIAFIPAVFLALLKSLETGQNFWTIIGLVLLVFAVVQTIQDAILTPKIMGDATGMNPAIILLSLSVWGKLLGILGLLIALPMTYLLISYYRRMISRSEVKKGPEISEDLIRQEDENLRKIPL